MSRTTKEVLVTFVSLVLGAADILLGDALWRAIGVSDVQIRNNLTTSFAILVILAGFLYAIYLMAERSGHDVLEALKSLRPFTMREHDGATALNILAPRLDQARRVLNVRLIPSDYQGRVYPNDDWNKGIVEAVTRKLHFVDIVSGSGRTSSDDIMSKLRSRGSKVKGRYTRVILDLPYKSFLNFKIFEFDDEPTEVWLGWRISKETTISEPCVTSTDERLVSVFEAWHLDLQRSGKRDTFPDEP